LRIDEYRFSAITYLALQGIKILVVVHTYIHLVSHAPVGLRVRNYRNDRSFGRAEVLYAKRSRESAGALCVTLGGEGEGDIEEATSGSFETRSTDWFRTVLSYNFGVISGFPGIYHMCFSFLRKYGQTDQYNEL